MRITLFYCSQHICFGYSQSFSIISISQRCKHVYIYPPIIPTFILECIYIPQHIIQFLNLLKYIYMGLFILTWKNILHIHLNLNLLWSYRRELLNRLLLASLILTGHLGILTLCFTQWIHYLVSKSYPDYWTHFCSCLYCYLFQPIHSTSFS